jgi:hypothetical protein
MDEGFICLWQTDVQRKSTGAKRPRRRARPCGKERGNISRLTGYAVDSLLNGSLVSSASRAESFVSDADEDDRQEGKNEAGSGADMPLAKHNAEVIRVPGKEHLYRQGA